MTPELIAFKHFVSLIDPTWPEQELASALGRAKALWTEAAISLPCVRKIRHYDEPTVSRRQTASPAPRTRASASDIDALIG